MAYRLGSIAMKKDKLPSAGVQSADTVVDAHLQRPGVFRKGIGAPVDVAEHNVGFHLSVGRSFCYDKGVDHLHALDITQMYEQLCAGLK